MRAAAFVTSLVVLFLGCAPKPSSTEVALIVSTTSPVALGPLQLRAVGTTWAAETYEARLGERSVTLLRTSPTTLSLLVPADAPSGQAVSFSEGSVTYRSPVLEVQPAPAVAEAATYVRTRVDLQLQALAVEEAAAPAELKPAFARAQVDLRTARDRFEALAPEDQALCAQLLSAASQQQRLLDPRQLYRSLDKEWKAFAWGAAITAVGVLAAPIWAVPAAVTVVVGVVLTAPAMPRLASLLADAYSQTLAAFESEAFTNQPLLSSVGFAQAVPKDMPLRWTLRTLRRSDTASPGALGELARLVEEIEHDWPAGTIDYPLPPVPPVFREPAIVEQRVLSGSSLHVSTVSGGIRLLSEEARPDALRLTFDDGITDGPGPMLPLDFTFTLDLVGLGEQLIVPATLRGRHGTLMTFELDGTAPPAFVKYDFATRERTSVSTVSSSDGASFMSGWDPIAHRLYVVVPRQMGDFQILGIHEETGAFDSSASVARGIVGLMVRRDGRLLVMSNPGDGSIHLLETEPAGGASRDLATLVPPGSAGSVGGIPSAGYTYDPRVDRAYVMTTWFAGGTPTGKLLVINATSGEIVKSFPTDPNINFLFASNAGLRSFSASPGGVVIEAFDTESGARSFVASSSEVTSFFTDFRCYDFVSDQLFIARDVRPSGAMLPRVEIVGVDPASGSVGTSITLRDGLNLGFGIQVLRPLQF